MHTNNHIIKFLNTQTIKLFCTELYILNVCFVPQLQTKRIVLIMEYCEGGSLYHMLDQAQYQYGLPEKQFLLVLFHVGQLMRADTLVTCPSHLYMLNYI